MTFTWPFTVSCFKKRFVDQSIGPSTICVMTESFFFNSQRSQDEKHNSISECHQNVILLWLSSIKRTSHISTAEFSFSNNITKCWICYHFNDWCTIHICEVEPLWPLSGWKDYWLLDMFDWKLKKYKYRISHGLGLDMIFIQRVVCFQSPSLGEVETEVIDTNSSL